MKGTQRASGMTKLTAAEQRERLHIAKILLVEFGDVAPNFTMKDATQWGAEEWLEWGGHFERVANKILAYQKRAGLLRDPAKEQKISDQLSAGWTHFLKDGVMDIDPLHEGLRAVWKYLHLRSGRGG